jgi:hypothetical protein
MWNIEFEIQLERTISDETIEANVIVQALVYKTGKGTYHIDDFAMMWSDDASPVTDEQISDKALNYVKEEIVVRFQEENY